MSSGRPARSTSTTGLPVATAASSICCWMPGRSSVARDAASLLMLAISPMAATTRSASDAAAFTFAIQSAVCSGVGGGRTFLPAS